MWLSSTAILDSVSRTHGAQGWLQAWSREGLGLMQGIQASRLAGAVVPVHVRTASRVTASSAHGSKARASLRLTSLCREKPPSRPWRAISDTLYADLTEPLVSTERQDSCALALAPLGVTFLTKCQSTTRACSWRHTMHSAPLCLTAGALAPPTAEHVAGAEMSPVTPVKTVSECFC